MQAQLLAEDLAGRMRANGEALAQGGYLYPARSVSRGCPSSSCQADRDLREWQRQVQEQLPGARFQVQSGDRPGSRIIGLNWHPEGNSGSCGTPGGRGLHCLEIRLDPDGG